MGMVPVATSEMMASIAGAPDRYDTGLQDCRAMTVMPDRPQAILAAGDRIAVVDLDSGATVHAPVDLEWGMKAVVGLADGRLLVATVKEVALYALVDGGVRRERWWPIASQGSLIGLGSTVDGSRFAVAAGDRILTGSITGDGLRTVPVGDCWAVSLSSDGRIVAACTGSGVDVFDALSLHHLRTLRVETVMAPLIAVALSPDGATVMAADDITRVLRWDLASAAHQELDPAAKAASIAWSPDSSCAMVVGLTQTVAVYAATGQAMTHLRPSESSTAYLVGGGWSADGRCVATGTEDGRIVVWRLGS